MINKEKFIRKIRIGRLRTFGGRLLIYAFLTGISYLLLFPFLYMVVTSVKNYSDLYDFTVKWVPHEFHWQNYAIAYNLLNYWNHFGNSLMLTTVCTLGHLLSASFKNSVFYFAALNNYTASGNYCTFVYAFFKYKLGKVVFASYSTVLFRCGT